MATAVKAKLTEVRVRVREMTSPAAELFQTTKQNIAKHLKAIFAEGELVQDSVVNHWLTTESDGKNYRVACYNLDAILAFGYRVRSSRGHQR